MSETNDNKFILTDDNYYSVEADRHYMSCSQFQMFNKCEAAAIAKLRGLYIEQNESEALFQGQYFHAALESETAFEKFCDENFDKIFKTKETKSRGIEITGKYAPFMKLDEMLEVMKKDAIMKKFLDMPGENEKFLTGKIGGVPWRIKMDKYCTGRRIVDYKTSANIWELYYNPETKTKQSFIEEYDYMMRAAVYGEIERQNADVDSFPTFIILAVSKQDPPDKAVIILNDDERWLFELEKVLGRLAYIQSLKNGSLLPKRCGMCEYCRSTKQIKRIMRYTDLMPEFRNDPDNVEYDDYGGTDIFTAL